MKQRFLIFLILIFVQQLISANDYHQKHILFCLKKDYPALNFDYTNGQIVTRFPKINDLFKKHGVVSVEKWLPGADERDIVDGVDLRKIYQVNFKNEQLYQRLQIILNDFRGLTEIHSADLEAVHRLSGTVQPLTPSDAYLSRQWYVNKIQANEAWNLWGDSIPGDSIVLVGVVDTGVDYTHPDLAGMLFVNLGEDINKDGQITDADKNNKDDDGNGYVDDFRGWDFAGAQGNGFDNDIRPPDAGPYQELSHGTHVGGIIAATANNGIGIAGISYRSKIIATKHAADNDLTEPGIISGYKGVDYCAKLGAKIINCSWGGGYDFYGKLVVDNVTKNYGAIVVSAAGNDNQNNDNNHHYPSDFDNAFAIAATTNNDVKTYYSNYGTVIDLSAPGGEGSSYSTAIYSTIHANAGSYAAWQGTSMASPVVAGALALLKAWFPDSNRAWLLTTIKNYAEPIDTLNPNYTGKLGAGRVNIYKAIAHTIYPDLLIDSHSFFEISGHSDQQFAPGERVALRLRLMNMAGWQGADNVKVSLQAVSTTIQLIDSVAMYGLITSGDTLSNFSDSLSFAIRPDAVYEPLKLRIRMEANDATAYPYLRQTEIDLMVSNYQPGFPYKNIYINAPLALDSFWGQDMRAVAVAGEKLYVFHSNGTNINAQWSTVGSTTMAPIVADLDGLSPHTDKEIVVINRSGVLHILTPNAVAISKIDFGESIYGDAAAGDVDGDGQLEIIFGTIGKKLHAVHKDKSEISGFPLNVSSRVNKGVALADMNDDNLPEMIFGTFDNLLHVITAAGDSLPPFPIVLPARVAQTPIIYNDGQSNYIIVTLTNKVLIIDADGLIKAEHQFGEEISAPPAIADLDADGVGELVICSRNGRLFALELDGTLKPNFPIALRGSIFVSPALADLDGDGSPEIVVSTDAGKLYIFRNDGSLFPHFPAQLSGSLNGSPAIGDFDGDGMLEIAVGGSDALHVLKIQGSDAQVAPYWSTYLGTNHRTGSFSDVNTGMPETNLAGLPNEFAMRQNYPNPFNPETVIDFTVPASATDKNISLEVFDILGRKVSTLFSGKAAAGHHQVVWNGRNSAGLAVGSGIYLYRLNGEGISMAKRMLLLK